jgi:NodT family efflux transporter outer membrane factor (OMF) lipoprotein
MRNHDDMKRATSGRPLTLAGAIALLGTVSALIGCAVGPKYESPAVPLNNDWREKDPRIATQTATDSAWWKVFGDPSLDELIQLAYRQDLSLQVAGLRILEARAQLGIAVGRQYPQLQAAFASVTAVGLSERAANVGTAGFDNNYWDYQVGFDALWELDFWGKFKQGVKAEAANYLATVADYDDALVSLTAEVARTYVVIRTFEVLVDQARTNATLQAEGLRIAESRFRHGATSELDASQASTLLESTRASIPQLEISLQQAQNALSTLLGQPVGEIQQIVEGPKGIPTAPPDVAVGVPAEMLRRRPDIRGAELLAVAQSARIGIAVADLYPSFSLFGSIGGQTSSGAGAVSGGSLFYAFGPRLLWPIFNYGRIKNNIRVQDARFQQSLVDYQNTVLRAAQEVDDGLIGFLKAQEAAVFGQNAVAGAQRSVNLAFVQYREGAVDFQRVLDTQRSLLQEENALAQTRSAIATHLIALYKALGGGWELRQGQPFVPDSTQVEMRNRTDWGDLLEKPPAEKTINALTAAPAPR